MYAFGMHPKQPSNVDASITILEMTLVAIRAAGCHFGPKCVLKVQGDNCTDNKSAVMLMYLAMLVHLDVFPEVGARPPVQYHAKGALNSIFFHTGMDFVPDRGTHPYRY